MKQEMIQEQKRSPVADTAFLPLIDMAAGACVPFVEFYARRLPVQMDPVGKSHLAESRYLGAEKVIEEKDLRQIIELGAGFTPHYQNLNGEGLVDSYIEVDLPENSEIKQGLLKQAVWDESMPTFVQGNVFDRKTWYSIGHHAFQNFSEEKPVGIFAEGFMQYTNPEQRKYLLDQMRPLLEEFGGFFFFEDSLTFHPEFSEIPEMRALSERMSKISKNDQLTNYISQEGLTHEFESYGFYVERMPAPLDNLTSRDLDDEGREVLSRFQHWILTPRPSEVLR